MNWRHRISDFPEKMGIVKLLQATEIMQRWGWATSGTFEPHLEKNRKALSSQLIFVA